MIKSVYIKNYKVFNEETFILEENNILIGNNASGKSSFLTAIDAFFNKETISKHDFNDETKDAEIGILTSEQKYLTKTYSCINGKVKSYTGSIDILSKYAYLYLSVKSLNERSFLDKFLKHYINENVSKNLYYNLTNNISKNLDIFLNNINLEKFKLDFNFDLKDALTFDIKNKDFTRREKLELLFELLTKVKYNNLIIALDEVEKLILPRISKVVLNIIKENFLQTLFVTHSNKVISNVDDTEILPFYRTGVKEVTEMYQNVNNKEKDSIYILVEGKTDVKWIKKVLELSGIAKKYIVIPCGGHTNIEPVKKELEESNITCKVIKDGDAFDKRYSLKKDCIELYIPLKYFNKLFNTNYNTLPNKKDEFFNLLRKENIGIDSAKKIISDNVEFFLKIDNPLVDEVLKLID